MVTSNNSSRPAYSRIYNLTPAGSRLAQYLEFLNSRPWRQDPEPEDPTEAVKRWIIANSNTVSMYMAKIYIRDAQDWQESVRWLFEYIWHDKMQRQAMDVSIISKADWDAIARWCQQQPDYLDDDRIPPERHDQDREQPLPKFPATFDDQAWSEEYPDDFYESGLPDSDEPVDDGNLSDDGED